MTSSILYFSISIMLTIFSLTGTVMKGMYINRTFNELTPDIVSDSIVHIDYSGTHLDPCYQPKLFQRTINDYFKMTLKGKIDKYKIGFVHYSFNESSQQYQYCSGSYSDWVKKIDVYFECTYNTIFNFKGKTSFEVTGDKL